MSAPRETVTRWRMAREWCGEGPAIESRTLTRDDREYEGSREAWRDAEGNRWGAMSHVALSGWMATRHEAIEDARVRTRDLIHQHQRRLALLDALAAVVS